MVKLSVAKYWFSFGYLDAAERKEYGPIVTIPQGCERFYRWGYACEANGHDFRKAARRRMRRRCG